MVKEKDIDFILKKIYSIWGIQIIKWNESGMEKFLVPAEYNALEDLNLKEHLVALALQRDVPVIYIDKYKIVFACIKNDDSYFFIGPVTFENINITELRSFYNDYGMGKGIEKGIPRLSFPQILSFVEMLASMILEVEYSDSDLIYGNELTNVVHDDLTEELSQFQIREDEKNAYHNTYMEERKMYDLIREGKGDEALELRMQMDTNVGVLAKEPMEHWKKLLVVNVTLATRAAIEAGVSTKTAFQLSDFYICKSDECTDIPSIIACRNQALKEISDCVKKQLEKKRKSNYVDACRDYIVKNYKEKLYLEEIAEQLKISPGYLSRIFSKETGMSMQTFVLNVRVEKAAQLLKYTDESLSAIASHVNFPSQSYFTKIFKQIKKCTPKEYRNSYRPNEYTKL